MKCEACERGDHPNCGLQTWCTCDCDPSDPGSYEQSQDTEVTEQEENQND